MNTIQRAMCAAILFGVAVSPGYSQASAVHTQTVPFDNPGRPGIVKVVSGEGDVTITGYSGREVRIKATASNPKALPAEDDPKAKGLKRIAGSGFSIITEREENAVVITRSLGDKTDLEIQAPFNTSLIIGGATSKKATGDSNDIQSIVLESVVGSVLGFSGGAFEGKITVENITGEIEASTLDGDIILKNVSGAVAANCMDGDITAIFRAAPENRPMAFSTIDGDVDVTLPPRLKATITASNVDGSVNTDFEMETVPGAVKKSDKAKSGVLNSLIGMQGRTITGKINGGGTEIQMKTIDGNIYIRKGK